MEKTRNMVCAAQIVTALHVKPAGVARPVVEEDPPLQCKEIK